MGAEPSRAEYDRPYDPRTSSDTYYPSGDKLAAYGGTPGHYHSTPPYFNDYLPPAQGRGFGNLPPPSSSFSSNLPPPSSSFSSIGTPSRGPLPMHRQAGGLFSTLSRPALDTVIIWDWDDTLMCSTAINSGRPVSPQLEQCIEEALTFSMQLGETMIVTNADDMWVFESSRRFAPRVRSILHQISVHSARRKYESKFPGDVFAWKRECFREILSQRGNSGRGLNLVALGDSPAEMEAAQTCTYGLPIHPVLVKTVKFKETPSSEELCDQLRLVMQDLRAIVEDEKDSSRNLAMWMRNSGNSSFLPQSSMFSPSFVQEMKPLSPLSPSMGSFGNSSSLEGSYGRFSPPPYQQSGSGVYLTSF